MQRALTLYSTSIGKKVAMALSGVLLLGFTVAHFAGNLNLYKGPEAFNQYAEFLHSDMMKAPLWTMRLLLLGAFLAHVVSAALLWSKNRAARPTRYAVKKDIASDYATKTMYLTGPTLLFFVLFHLAHMTFGQTFGVYEWVEGNPYDNLVHGFQQKPLAALYILGNVSLGMHLFHGIYSAFQSVGANHAKYNHLRRDVAIGLATLLTLGNVMFPVMVQLGKVRSTDQATEVEGFGESGTPMPIPLH